MGSSFSSSLCLGDGESDDEENVKASYTRFNSVTVRTHHKQLDSMSYEASRLTAWRYTFTAAGSVFGSKTLWCNMFKLVAVGIFVACLVYFVWPDPLGLHLGKFRKICSFLNFFVGLLLGFFVKSSVGRWFMCVDGFLELTDAVRNLQMQLYALGVPEEKIDLVIRYGYVSAWLLNVDLHVMILDEDETNDYRGASWHMLDSSQENRETRVVFEKGGHLSRHRTLANLSPIEIQRLRLCDEPASMIWFWVASYVARLAQDKHIPPMASPTYGRIMTLCQNAHLGIRDVRASMQVQLPFVYLHILCSIVHINNIITAIAFGLTLGPSMGVLLLMCGVGYHDHLVDSDQPRKEFDRVSMTILILDFQDVIVNFFYSMVGPFLYTAILEMGILISQPFTSKICQIPTPRLLEGLAHDLDDGKMMADKTFWEKPSYGACI